MQQEELIQKLLEIEEDSRILDFKLPKADMPIWPLMRAHVLFHLYYRLSNMSEGGANTTAPAFWDTLLKIPCYLYWTVTNRPPKGALAQKIVYVTSDIYNVMDKDEKFTNRMHDSFANIFAEDSVLLERSHELKYARPRTFKNVYCFDYYYMKSMIQGTVNNIFRVEQQDIEAFISFLRARLARLFPDSCDQFENFIESLRKRLCLYDCEMYYLKKNLLKLFSKEPPKLIFVDNGSYGFRYAVIMSVAKSLGIASAEIQHGFVSKAHFAYNYHEKIVSEPVLKNYLPSYYLMHGSYWANRVNTPSEVVLVGNPNLPSSHGEVAIRYEYLIISQGHVANRIMDLALELDEKTVHQAAICYRLHPNEVANYSEYEERLKNTNIYIDYSANLSDLISESKNVIGVDSTVLWEAWAITNRIFVYNCVPGQEFYTDTNFGIWFANADELVAKSSQEVKGFGIDKESVWCNDWQINFRKFICRSISICRSTDCL